MLSNWQQAGPWQTKTSLIVLAGMIVTIGSALAFEHVGGYAPCALCLEQRQPYYWGIPILAAGVIAALMQWSPFFVRVTLAVAAICMIVTAGMGVYHSGIEWGIFAAPQSCGAGLSATSSDAGSLLDSLASAKPPSCDVAAGRFFGLSFANWNVVAAAVLAAIAASGAFSKAN